MKKALENNYGKPLSDKETEKIAVGILKSMADSGIEINDEIVARVIKEASGGGCSREDKEKYDKLLEMIDEIPKFGNDNSTVDAFARDVAYTYTRPLEKYKNPERRTVPGRTVSRFGKCSARCSNGRNAGRQVCTHPGCGRCFTGGGQGCQRSDRGGELGIAARPLYRVKRNFV